MTDEKYVFKQTEKERKRVARGAYNKKNGSRSKMCRLPSDSMTESERRAMNGKVFSYDLSKPMDWFQFKTMPKDIQKEYVLKLSDEIGAGRKDIAEMFGIDDQRLSNYLYNRHNKYHFFEGKKRNREAFEKWLRGDSAEETAEESAVETVAETVVEPAVETVVETVVEPKKEEIVEKKKRVAKSQTAEVVEVETSVIEAGELEFRGSAKDVFERMMNVLDSGCKYRIRIRFKMEDVA